MARVILAALLLALPGVAQDQQFKQAGVCARCHVISVVEWSISRHAKATADCVACHGKSEGHIIDERNNVKPERSPRAAAIVSLCATCHAGGCPKTKRKDACETCHHAHALLNPEQAPSAKDEALDRKAAQRAEAAKRFAEGEKLVAAARWAEARREFTAALAIDSAYPDAAARVVVCDRRLRPGLRGFEKASDEWDRSTGLLREVRVEGVGLAMVLVAGGEFDMGSERFPVSRPVRTVQVGPFYLGKFEVTQAEWKAVMGAGGDARVPVERVSWDDAQAFVAKLNERVPGGGFRLPAEAEWEFAARVKTGAVDLVGGVWEWCEGLWAEGSPLRVLRGGGRTDSPDLRDPAMRHAERPGRRLPGNGFRVARTIPAP
jgi:formylglycine-generating enzyme required for sulfatase activity